MKKTNHQDRNLDAEKKSALVQASAEDDEFNDTADIDDFALDMADFEELEWISAAKDFRSMAVRRQLEARLEELALRRDLEDFPDYHILN
jgi:hypothetical protein